MSSIMLGGTVLLEMLEWVFKSETLV